MPQTRTPGPVPQDTLAYFKAKDLRVGFDYRDVWGDEHAHAFTVAKMTRLDLLQTTKDSLAEALANGETFRDWSKRIKPEMAKRGWWGVAERIDPRTGDKQRVQLGSPRRLKTIYRANMRSARAAGQWQRIQRTKESRPYLVYMLGPSDEHRAEHVDLQGLTLPVDDATWSEIYPPNGYGCFAPETIVRCNAELGLKTWYTGEMVELKTARGNHLTVTFNHPILTARGWVAAGDLAEGDKLLDAGADVDITSGVAGLVDNEQAPARADELFDAFAAERLRVVPMAAHDFYGDTVGRYPEIHVASLDRELMDRVDASAEQRIREAVFGVGHHRGIKPALKAEGPARAALIVSDAVPPQDAADARFGHAQALSKPRLTQKPGAVKRDDLALNVVVGGISGLPGRAKNATGLATGFDADPAMFRGGALAALGNASTLEDSSKSVPAHSQVFRELLERNPGLVGTDELIFIRKFDWSGHVYDFETDTGLIVAGGIVVSNCKCWIQQIDKATRDDYEANGVPDATAEAELDPETGLPTGRRVTRQVPAKTTPPKLKRKRYVNKRTGEIAYAPEGVHPAWANNSGQARVRVLRAALTNKITAADRQLAITATANVVDSPVFSQFMDDAAAHSKALAARDPAAIDAVGELPIGVLSPHLQQADGAAHQLLRISGETMAKQLREHSDLKAGDYSRIQRMLDTGIALKARDRLMVFTKDGDRYRQAVLKITGKKNKAYLVSYHYASPRRLREAMKRAKKDGRVIRSGQR